MRSAVGRLLPRAGLLRAAGGAAGRLAQAGEGVAAGAAAAVSPASVGAEARGLASASSVGSRGIWSSPRGIADAGFARSGALSASPERQAYYSLAVRTLQTSRGSLVDAPAAQPANRIAVGEPVPIGGVHYKVIGRLELGKAFQVAKKDLFAVVEVGPHQFKVTTDDLIYVEKLGDVDINDKVSFGKVLMLGTLTQTTVGRPVVPLAEVHAVVEEQVRDAKQMIFKKRRRKNSRRLTAHRQQLTALRIVDIIAPGQQ